MKKWARPYWIGWVNGGWLHTQPLFYSPSFLNRQEKKVRQEGLWDKIKTGTSLSTCCHKQKGLNLGKANVIYCQLRIEVDSEKQVQILKHLLVKTSSTYLFFSGTLSPLHPPPLHLLPPRGAGAGARWCGLWSVPESPCLLFSAFSHCALLQCVVSLFSPRCPNMAAGPSHALRWENWSQLEVTWGTSGLSTQATPATPTPCYVNSIPRISMLLIVFSLGDLVKYCYSIKIHKTKLFWCILLFNTDVSCSQAFKNWNNFFTFSNLANTVGKSKVR